VFGAGGVGLSALIAAVHLTGATTAVVDVNPARLELATKLGAAHVVNARETDVVEALMEFSGGRGIDRTLEAPSPEPSSSPCSGYRARNRFQGESWPCLLPNACSKIRCASPTSPPSRSSRSRPTPGSS
jgi:threonine dehydrogenase-like Zn-dependent dehydrogenase